MPFAPDHFKKETLMKRYRERPEGQTYAEFIAQIKSEMGQKLDENDLMIERHRTLVAHDGTQH